MDMRVLRSRGDGIHPASSEISEAEARDGWTWTDVVAGPDDLGDLMTLTAEMELDAVAVRDAVEEYGLPKVDDFGHHLLVILHGIREDLIGTAQVDCFLTDRKLVTVRSSESPAINALWARLSESADLASGGADQLLARLADGLTRHLLAVVDAFDDGVESLVEKALTADPGLLEELTEVRSHFASIRRVALPQRETLDMLRQSPSHLIGATARRRFSDAFDVATRATQGLESARTALAEILDAYQGAEARKATSVTTVLTIYAAIMLPLSLIAGFFGMNFPNIPGFRNDMGWIITTALMVVIAVGSLAVFVAAGWIRRPARRRVGGKVGRRMIEVAKAPVGVASAVYEVATVPLRPSTWKRRSGSGPLE